MNHWLNLTEPLWKQIQESVWKTINPKKREECVIWMSDYLEEKCKQQIREAYEKDGSEWWAPAHFFWGMGIRNAMRRHGFGEIELNINNLDDIYVKMIEVALDLE